MTSISYVTPEEYTTLLQRIDRLEKLLEAYVATQDEWLNTASALRVTGIKSRTTLVQFARASAPGIQENGRITYAKEGTRALYSRASCIDYRLRKLGQPALRE
jgi:hypothetical protein